MVGHGGCSASSYLADPTSPIPSHCALMVATSTVRVDGAVTTWRSMDDELAHLSMTNALLTWASDRQVQSSG